MGISHRLLKLSDAFLVLRPTTNRLFYWYESMKSLFLAALLFVFYFDGISIVHGDEIQYATMTVDCRFDGDDYEIDIPLDVTGGVFTWGAITHYNGDDGKDIPCGEAIMPGWQIPMAIPTKYEYSEVDINENWFVVHAVGIDANGVVYHTFTKADNKAYWDNYYTGYTSVGGLDYDQNCHGYAFGAGDWPETAHAFIGQGWAPGEQAFPSFEEPVIKTSSEQFKGKRS